MIENDLLKSILIRAKNDGEFFDELMNFFERQEKRELILSIVRRILLDESEKIYS